MKSYVLYFLISVATLENACGRILTQPADVSAEIAITPYKHQIKAQPTLDCHLKIRGGFKDPQPLLLKSNATEYFPFSAKGDVVITRNETIKFYCSSGFVKPFHGKDLIAKCAGNTTFIINSEEYDVSELRCATWPAFVAKRTSAKCPGGTTLIHVGFQLSDSTFLKQYEVCFDEHEETTRYTHYTLEPGSNHFATGTDRITFASAGFFKSKNVDKLYTQHKQSAIFKSSLDVNATKYINMHNNMFLARGHLTAKADFVYAPQQRATFLFINAAPQWQVFNAGNWARVEDSLRAWVTKTQRHVECWTGVWGVTTLPNSHGQETELYLSRDQNNNGLIPVPKLYFRVVVEQKTGKGIVLVGVNNPYLSLDVIKRDYVLCPDISDKIKWITWKKHDIRAGYSYACEVAEFRKKVTHLPELTVTGLLL